MKISYNFNCKVSSGEDPNKLLGVYIWGVRLVHTYLRWVFTKPGIQEGFFPVPILIKKKQTNKQKKTENEKEKKRKIRQIFNYLEETVWSCNEGLIITWPKQYFLAGQRGKSPAGKISPSCKPGRIANENTRFTPKHSA